MKLSFNNKEVLELSETQKKVIQNDILLEIFEDDMTRRCKYWLESPCEKYVHRRKLDISKKLKDKNLKSLPIDNIALGKKYAEEFPCTHGYSDINKALLCKVGSQEFELSTDHQIIWRKFHESSQKTLSKDSYMVYETKVFEARMAWILQHKYEKCLERLKLEWLPKLEVMGMKEIPSDDDVLAKLIFAQPDYKSRSQKEEV